MNLNELAKILGSVGGTHTKNRHPEHLRTISKLGVEARRRNKAKKAIQIL